MTDSTLERTFLHYLRILAPELPEPTQEHQFAPPRKWRFDFAWIEQKVAVEIEGMSYNIGRHQRTAGYAADCEKYNQALCEGWKVLRYTGKMLTDNPQMCIDQVRALLDMEIPDHK